MRVLHVFYGRDFVGGASYSMSELAIGLNNMPDFEVSALVPWTRKHEMRKFLEEHGVNTFEAPIVHMADKRCESGVIKRARYLCKRCIKTLLNLAANAYVGLLLERCHFDAVHIGGAVITCGARSALKRGVPIIWHLREYGDLDWDLYLYDEARTLRDMSRSTACIAVSRSVEQHYLKKSANLPTHVVYNGIAPLESVVSLGSPACQRESCEPLRIGFFGGIREGKGTFDLLDAVGRLASDGLALSLDVYGPCDATSLQRFNAMVDSYGLCEEVRYIGWSKVTLSTYRDYDLTVVASRCEAFGRVTAESQLAGVLVVGADSGGTRELLSHGRGLLYVPGDASSLAEKIRWANCHWDDVRHMVSLAYEYAIENYTTEKYVSSIASLYRTEL